MKHNGYIPGKHFFRVQADLRDPKRVAGLLQRTRRRTAILSQIGYWPSLYEISNKAAIHLAGWVPHVVLFLAAGYHLKYPDEAVQYDRDRELLERYGFKPGRAVRWMLIASFTATRANSDKEPKPLIVDFFSFRSFCLTVQRFCWQPPWVSATPSHG